MGGFRRTILAFLCAAAGGALCAGAASAQPAGTAGAQDTPASVEITAPGPQGSLGGSLITAGDDAPVALIIPGSGPTDRNGDNPQANAGGYLRVLAERLAARGISSVRIDKRGSYASAGAIAGAQDISVSGYVDDVESWVSAIRERTGASCVWLLGHSEGGLIALSAARRDLPLCGIVLLETAGRPLGTVMREQFRANPANAPLLDTLLGLVDRWEAGDVVPAAELHPVLARIFPESAQRYLTDVVSRDPAALAAAYDGPLLIVQGTRDIQVTLADAAALKAAQPEAELMTIEGMNHLLKRVESADYMANVAAYSNPDLPVVPEVAPAIADFILADPRGE